MGNRAVVTFYPNPSPKSKCVYLHWNGGVESVIGFLEATKILGLNSANPKAATEAFFGVTAKFFGSGSAYLEEWRSADKDNYDNGVYYVDPKSWQIVKREYADPRDSFKKETSDLDPEGVVYCNGVRDEALAKNQVATA